MQPAPSPAFCIFDADNHYYEPRDAFTRHLDPRLADRAVKVVTDASGKDTIFVAGQKHHFTPPTFELVPPPGHLKEMLKSHGEGTAASFLKPMRPEYQQRSARLAIAIEQRKDGARRVQPAIAVRLWPGAPRLRKCIEQPAEERVQVRFPPGATIARTGRALSARRRVVLPAKRRVYVRSLAQRLFRSLYRVPQIFVFRHRTSPGRRRPAARLQI